VPQNPGAFSALGILISDVVKDVSQSVLRTVPESGPKPKQGFHSFHRALQSDFRRLEAAASAELRKEQSTAVRATVTRYLDLRYRGQAYELTVPFATDFPAHFHREHEKAYGYAHGGRALEIVNLRVRLALATPKPPTVRAVRGPKRKLSDAVANVRPVWFDSRSWETPFFDRGKLSAGMKFQGPAVILEYSSTTVVPPGCLCEVDEHGDLILRSVRL
jgi:N-methylhydantoinase A